MGGRGGVWIHDYGATMHITGDRTRVYDFIPPVIESGRITIGDLREFSVKCFEKLRVVFHGHGGVMTLLNVVCVSGSGFDLFSLHVLQEKYISFLITPRVYLLGGRVTFPRSRSGSHMSVTRVARVTAIGYPLRRPRDCCRCDCPRQDTDNTRGSRYQRYAYVVCLSPTWEIA